MKRDLYLTPYSFKSLDISTEEKLKIAKDIGFDGVEGGILTDEYIEILEKYNLKCVNCVLKIEEDGTVSEEYLQKLENYSSNKIVNIFNPDEYKKMQDQTKGYRGIPGAFGTFDMAIEVAKKASETAEFADTYGLQTMFHNHTHEWRMENGEYIMDTYLRHTPSNHVMEFDVGWALTAGIDPIYWMQKWPGRIGALHIKSCNWTLGAEALGMSCPVPPLEHGISRDQQQLQQIYAEGPQGPMEQSICDWKAVIESAEQVGCNVFIIERERIYSDSIIDCVAADYEWIRKCMS